MLIPQLSAEWKYNAYHVAVGNVRDIIKRFWLYEKIENQIPGHSWNLDSKSQVTLHYAQSHLFSKLKQTPTNFAIVPTSWLSHPPQCAQMALWLSLAAVVMGST